MLTKMRGKAVAEGPVIAKQQRNVGLLSIFSAFFVLGLTAFGLAILQKLKGLVLGRG